MKHRFLIVGKGVVGQAFGKALVLDRGHQVTYLDPPKGIHPGDQLAGVTIAAICVPTPFRAGTAHGFDEGPIVDALHWLTCFMPRSNGIYALKVAFTNKMYDLALRLRADPAEVEAAVLADPMLSTHHLKAVHKGYRGFGGKCLPKDLKTLIVAMEDAEVDPSILAAASTYNDALLKAQGVDETLRAQSSEASGPDQPALPSAPETP